MTAAIIQRFHATPVRGIDPAARLRIEEGTIADYDALARHHYRDGRPATWVKVLRMVDPGHPQWTVDSGQLTSGEGGSAVHCPLSTVHCSSSLVAVLVVSMPTLNGAWREPAWPEQELGRRNPDGTHAGCGTGRFACPSGAEEGVRRAGPRGCSPPDAGSSPLATVARPSGATVRREAAERLNAEFRTISRLVVHPSWRGLGLGTRLVRAYLDNPLTPRTEAVTAMGPFCPVFAAAGMREVPIPPTRADDALRRALSGTDPADLADPVRARRLIARHRGLRRALRAWAWRWRGARRLVESGDIVGIARIAAGRLVAERVAFVAGEKAQSANRKAQIRHGVKEAE